MGSIDVDLALQRHRSDGRLNRYAELACIEPETERGLAYITRKAKPFIDSETEIGIVLIKLLEIEASFGQAEIKRPKVGRGLLFCVLP